MNKLKSKILLAEDDLMFGEVLKSYLEMNDFEVTWCKNGIEAFKTFHNSKSWSICLLDVMMPEMDGFTLATEMRKLNQNVPLFFLTAKTLKEDVLKGYKCGADDYILKPFDAEVLKYKITAIQQRLNQSITPQQADEFSLGKFTFNYSTRLLISQSTKTQLSPKESELLKLLCLYKNNLLPREIALKNIWENDDYFNARSMDVYIAKLRKHLKEDTQIEIVSIHGKGFRLSDELISL